MDMRKRAEDIPAVMAMSGTPVSVGPADNKGPLMCLTSDQVGGQSQNSSVINDLDRMDQRFNELVEMDPTSTDMTTLISNFGAVYYPRTLRTEDSLRFGDTLSVIHQRTFLKSLFAVLHSLIIVDA